MICVDTTFLVDLWREKDNVESPARRLLGSHPGEDFAVPAHAAGEFLEGGAAVSSTRLAESLSFLRLFRVGGVTVETAVRYARIVAHRQVQARPVDRGLGCAERRDAGDAQYAPLREHPGPRAAPVLTEGSSGSSHLRDSRGSPEGSRSGGSRRPFEESRQGRRASDAAAG